MPFKREDFIQWIESRGEALNRDQHQALRAIDFYLSTPGAGSSWLIHRMIEFDRQQDAAMGRKKRRPTR